MSTVTDAEVEAAQAELSERGWLIEARHLRPALEAAEAVRVKGVEPATCKEGLPVATPTIPEGFIPWPGGECPVSNTTLTQVELRDKETTRKLKLDYRWEWKKGSQEPNDIIGYRPAKPDNFRLEAGKFYVTASGERVGPMRIYDAGAGLFDLSYDDDRLWLSEGSASGGPRDDILALAANQENSHD